MKKLFENKESNVRSYSRKYDVVFDRAKEATLYDIDDNQYIDFFAGAGTLNYGHNNNFIKSKIIEYLNNDSIIHGLDFFTKAKYDFIEKLYSVILTPRGLDYKIMFTGPTGTNAIEASLKLARKITKRRTVLAFSGAFHGMTLGSLALTTDKTSRKGAGVELHDVVFIPFESGGNYNIDSLSYLESLLEDDHAGIEKPAAVFFESIQAEGGVNVASNEWIFRLSEICKKNEILLVCDDIQVGCGRTGTFFSFENSNIQPDMIVLSKSLSGYGFPLSILLLKPDLDIWKPAEHNGTFRGNQIAFVSATAALDYWINNDFSKAIIQKASIIESFLKRHIIPLNNKITIRGKGMIWAIDFSDIRENLASELIIDCFEKGLIIETCGRNDNSLKLLPPLTIDDKTLIQGLNIIYEAIKSHT